jgi:DNA repair exonuclease SbcCD ATPase subunit
LAEKASEIREKGTQANSAERDLVEVITIVLFDYSDWKTQLEELEAKFNKLKDFTKGGQKYTVVENYSMAQKESLEKLKNKMEAKIKEWRSEKAKAENNNSSNPSWYKTTWGKIGIATIIVIVVSGALYYFLRQNPNEEE